MLVMIRRVNKSRVEQGESIVQEIKITRKEQHVPFAFALPTFELSARTAATSFLSMLTWATAISVSITI